VPSGEGRIILQRESTRVLSSDGAPRVPQNAGVSLTGRAALVYRALVSPASVPLPERGLRSLLLRRRLFDIVSVTLQLRDARRLRTIKDDYGVDDPYHRRVQDYNAGVTLGKVVTTGRRAEPLYRVATLLPRDVAREDLLIVGPRNVQELLTAWLHGFSWSRIQGIDLYSTNPKIRVMNMESLTFADGSFDVIVMSNTLAYASDTFKCLSELQRVLRVDGRLVFGATYDPGDEKWAGSVITGDQIRQMLRELRLDLYYYFPSDKVNVLGRVQTSHFFGCVKRNPREAGFDRIQW
jgi:SAM-dependent methyltransferase